MCRCLFIYKRVSAVRARYQPYTNPSNSSHPRVTIITIIRVCMVDPRLRTVAFMMGAGVPSVHSCTANYPFTHSCYKCCYPALLLQLRDRCRHCLPVHQRLLPVCAQLTTSSRTATHRQTPMCEHVRSRTATTRSRTATTQYHFAPELRRERWQERPQRPPDRAERERHRHHRRR